MKIQVKEEHIKNGRPEDCENCAVALAVKDSLKADSVSVTLDGDENIEISAWFDKLSYKEQKDIRIMDSDQTQVNHFVDDFDSHYKWDYLLFKSINTSGWKKCSSEGDEINLGKVVFPFEFEVNYG